MTEEKKDSTFSYTLKSTRDSSMKYGSCEVCGKSVAEVYHQVCEISYVRHDGSTGWYFVESIFGHKECLIGKRK